MTLNDLRLGTLRFRAPSSWRFYDFGNVVLGGASAKGSLQITLVYANDSSKNAGHEECVAIMQQFMNEPVSTSVYAERVPQEDAVFGFSTIHDANVFRRYWYRQRGGQLLLAVFQCPAEKFAGMRHEIDEASTIAATMELVS